MTLRICRAGRLVLRVKHSAHLQHICSSAFSWCVPGCSGASPLELILSRQIDASRFPLSVLLCHQLLIAVNDGGLLIFQSFLKSIVLWLSAFEYVSLF